ncbi:hypothetical protein BDW75DRAFT_220130 [Aspergillus navahoensis]
MLPHRSQRPITRRVHRPLDSAQWISEIGSACAGVHCARCLAGSLDQLPTKYGV